MGIFCIGSGKRTIACRVLLLDGTEVSHEFSKNVKCQAVFDTISDKLNLKEREYFSLKHKDENDTSVWLDMNKRLTTQIKASPPYILHLMIKFYAADPCALDQELTRYLFYLQVKDDAMFGRLPCTFAEAAQIGAYSLQAELGDYNPQIHADGYVSEFRIIPKQSEELEDQIMEIHKTVSGLVPPAAEMLYLDFVKWLAMYGTDKYPVKGDRGVEYFLGLKPTGIIVIKNDTLAGTFVWPSISKLNFKNSSFSLAVRGKDDYENIYEFELPSAAACKQFWKRCIDHHAFFRMQKAANTCAGAYYWLSNCIPNQKQSTPVEKQNYRKRAEEQYEFSRVVRLPSKRFPRRTSTDDSLGGRASRASSIAPSVDTSRLQGSRGRDVEKQPISRSRDQNSDRIHRRPSSASQASGSSSRKSPRTRRRRHIYVDSGSESDTRRSYHSRMSDDEIMRRRRRSSRRSNGRYSSDTEATYRHRRIRKRSQSSDYRVPKMIDSRPQWNEIQRRQHEIQHQPTEDGQEPTRIPTDRASLLSGREGDGDTKSIASGHSRGSRSSRRRGSRGRERRGSYGRERGKHRPPLQIDRENEIWIDKGPEGDQPNNSHDTRRLDEKDSSRVDGGGNESYDDKSRGMPELRSRGYPPSPPKRYPSASASDWPAINGSASRHSVEHLNGTVRSHDRYTPDRGRYNGRRSDNESSFNMNTRYPRQMPSPMRIASTPGTPSSQPVPPPRAVSLQKRAPPGRDMPIMNGGGGGFTRHHGQPYYDGYNSGSRSMLAYPRR